MKKVKKVTGHQGLFHSTVAYDNGSKDELSNVHPEYSCFRNGEGLYYQGIENDPNWIAWKRHNRFGEWFQMIFDEHKVVLINETIDEDRTRRRNGHIAVFEVSNVKLSEDELTFRFTKRLQET